MFTEEPAVNTVFDEDLDSAADLNVCIIGHLIHFPAEAIQMCTTLCSI